MTEDTNVSVLVGRLTKDAELKLHPEMSVGYFTIAVNRKKRKATGDEEASSYIDINVYGNYAEIIIPSLKRGVQVSIVGSLKQDRWIEQGTRQNKSRLVVTANSIQILEGTPERKADHHGGQREGFVSGPIPA